MQHEQMCQRHAPQPRSALWHFDAIVCGILLVLSGVLRAEEPKPKVVLGLGSGDAAKYNVEFMRYGRMQPLYAENGIQASLMDYAMLFGTDCTAEQVYAALKPYHVVAFGTSFEGVHQLDANWRKRAAAVGQGLARYVQEGGGLLLHPNPVRYPNSDDEKYWNLVFAPLGLEILHEGVYDKTRVFEKSCPAGNHFWFTRNIQAHPVTEKVAGLCLPLHGLGDLPGVVAVKYSSEWEVVVSGEPEAKSYKSGVDNNLDLAVDGTYAKAPPVVAVRSFGKGRVACYSLSSFYLGMNYGNPLWPHIVENKGDPDGGRPSDSMRLMMNAYRWLAAPALGLPEFGTYRPEPYKPAAFPPKVDFSKPVLTLTPEQIAGAKGVRAVVGAHSSYSDGKGTVAQYAAAAKAAGIAVIVFADPLEQLTPEKLAALKADCAAASKAGDFYACPGVEFTDGIGDRWAFWGEKIVWPDASYQSGKYTYVQWDGKRVNLYGQYSAACGYVGSALLDYQQFRKNGAHPENLWWFYHYLPLVFDHGKLVADNFSEYLFGLRDMRSAALVSFTRITDPTEVAPAANLCYTGFNSLQNAKTALNTRCSVYGEMCASGQYVSQGPAIVSWAAVNNQRGGDAKTMAGAQRVRLYFAVRSDQGIAEVRVHDADRGVIRRFLGHGEKQLAREFELVHDRARYPTLEVIDTAGQRAFSRYVWLFCYKSELFRCGDNLNILGPTAMCWHPDRNQFFDAAKDFRNGSDFCLVGWDTSSSTMGVPTPQAMLLDMIHINEVPGHTGEYPHPSALNAISGRLMDVGINNSDLQIATMRMTKLSERYETEQRCVPVMASPPRDVGELEYYDRTHTIYAPMERVNMFVAWDWRRDKESRQNYRGGIIWHEGEYRFKKDVTFKNAVPIHLYGERTPVDLEKGIGTTLVVTDAAGPTRVALVRDAKTSVRVQGRLRPGGYAAWMPYPVGYHAFLAPADMNFGYDAYLSSPGSLHVGIGELGQVVKAGTVLKYHFGVATFADPTAGGNDLIEQTIKAMNLGGGHDGYPVEMKAGELKDAVFFFTAAAKDNEAAFTLGPQSLLIDLPVRVQGLADNGCTAVYSTKLPRFRFIPVDAEDTAWLTEAIDQKNELWVGNVFTCDNKEIKLTLVLDGQADGAPPLLEVHNPTDQPLSATLKSPPHTPLFAGVSSAVTVSAGDSVWLVFRDGKLLAR